MISIVPILILVGQLAMKYGDNILDVLKVLMKDNIDVNDIQKLRDLVKPPEDYIHP